MPEVTIEVQTPEQIAQHYSAMGDSVDLINAGQPEDMSAEDWADMKSRNQEHLVLMLAKDFWTDAQDMTAVTAAIAV
jgi:hypothetical protein